MSRKRRSYQTGGSSVILPPVYDVPDFGGIGNPTNVQAPPLDLVDMGNMLDPTRYLAQRESALMRRQYQKEQQMAGLERTYRGYYDELFGEVHNPDQRNRLQAIRTKHGIKDIGEINLTNEAEIRAQTQKLLSAVHDDETRAIFEEVAAANLLLKRAGSLEAPEAEKYNEALIAYYNNDGTTTPSRALIDKLNPALYNQAAAERKQTERVYTMGSQLTRMLMGMGKSWDKVGDETSQDRANLRSIAEGILMQAPDVSIKLGYLEPIQTAEGQPAGYRLTETGDKWAVAVAVQSFDAARQGYLWNLAGKQQAKTEKADTKAAAMQDYWNLLASALKQVTVRINGKEIQVALANLPWQQSSQLRAAVEPAYDGWAANQGKEDFLSRRQLIAGAVQAAIDAGELTPAGGQKPAGTGAGTPTPAPQAPWKKNDPR